MRKRIENLMVIVDFSEQGMKSVQTAVKICKRHNACMHLLFIHNTDYLFPTAGMQAPVFNLSQEQVASEIDNLQTYASSIERNYGIRCIPHHEAGPLYSTISRKTQSINCDMLVVTDKGEGALFRNSIGYEALKAATCPVLILRGKHVDRFRNIVFPVRRVPNALDKLAFTRTLALKNKAHAYIVGALDKKDKAGYNTIKLLVSAAKSKLASSSISCAYEINAGKDVVSEVLAVCEERSADLLVITASTMRTFKQIFFGNYAQNIINNGSTPVLCVKPGTVPSKKATGFMFSHSMLA